MDPMQPPTNPSQTPDEPQAPQSPVQSTTPPAFIPEQPMTDVTPEMPSTNMPPVPPVSSPVAQQQPPIQPVPTEPMNNPFQPTAPVDPFAAQQSQQQFTQPEPTLPMAPNTPGWKKFIIPAIIVVAAIVVLVGGYFAFTFISSKFQKVTTTNTTNQVANSTKANAPDINTLKSFTLLAPDASKTQDMTPTQVQAATELTSSDGACTLIYGIETQAQLPGTDIGDVISQYLAKLKQQSPHLVVNGPNQAAALVLSGTDGKSYSLPTVNFTYTDSTQAGAANGIYSVSQLSDGSHAVVASICGSDTAKSASDLQSQVASLESAAATIKVQVK